jgi:acyl-CoA synthetase (AMP-forming)/AMP-acid ligase II
MSELTHLPDFLAAHAASTPSKPAVITDSRTLTWQELQREVSAAAAVMQERLPAADNQQQIIAILLPNTWEFVVTYLAILQTGQIAAPLDHNYKALEIGAITQQLPPALLITDAAGDAKLERPAAPVLHFNDLAAPATTTRRPPLRQSADTQIASLMFTSGTTGKPKAAPYTHANHIWNIELSTKLWNWTADDTLLISLPLSHWHGIVMGVAGMLVRGSTMYLRPHFDAEDTLQLLASGKISIFQHVAQVYVKLAEHQPAQDYDLSRVRLCTSASSALPPAAWHKLKERYGIEILECYGSAEAGRIASNTLTERIPGSPGYIIDGVQAKLGPAGEILVKTPGLFPGYYNNPEATAASTRDGWWVMGDIGEFDETGRLHIKGRMQEKIKKHGYSLYPRDIEWALLKNPAISEAFVLGVQDDNHMNDRLVYFLATSLSDSSIVAWTKQHLPSAWRADQIVRLDAVPRTRTGKPKLTELRALMR